MLAAKLQLQVLLVNSLDLREKFKMQLLDYFEKIRAEGFVENVNKRITSIQFQKSYCKQMNCHCIFIFQN